MTEAPDIEQLARRYIDLWQDQAAALISDPALAEAMGRAYALMSKAAPFPGAAAAQGNEGEGGADSTDIRAAACANSATASAGSTPITPASGGPGLDPADIAARLAFLEERVLRLEAALAANGGRAEELPRRGRR